jgi:4-diphosphocytidyl-2-C-methyl-D-erythritol kinase
MKILSPAKINLFLQVTGKRADGYHDLFSLMCCVSLYDTIQLRFGGKGIEIESAHPHVPLDETNIAYKAADLFYKNLGVQGGLKISIEKSIPVAAGLGGGSSNAASVLDGLNHFHGHPFSRERLMSMGLRLGADVPFFLFETPALASGIGERLEAYSDLPTYDVVLVNPGFAVSTAEVFRNLNLGLTKCKKKLKKPSFRETGYIVSRHLCNDLEAVTASRYPVIRSIKKQLLEQGALGALMSGSGPTVFGLFSDPEKAAAACRVFCGKGRCKSFLVQTVNKRHPVEP